MCCLLKKNKFQARLAPNYMLLQQNFREIRIFIIFFGGVVGVIQVSSFVVFLVFFLVQEVFSSENPETIRHKVKSTLEMATNLNFFKQLEGEQKPKIYQGAESYQGC